MKITTYSGNWEELEIDALAIPLAAEEMPDSPYTGREWAPAAHRERSGENHVISNAFTALNAFNAFNSVHTHSISAFCFIESSVLRESRVQQK